MKFSRLVAFITGLAIFMMAFRLSIDGDTWWHLRAGEWMLDHAQILDQDPFSLTRQGEPWRYPGWLAQVALYSVYRAWGLSGLNALTAVLALLPFLLLWRVVDGPPLLKAFVLVLAAASARVFWSARPQMFSFALAGAFLWLLERHRRDQATALWPLPVLMVVWVNLHGGFVIGLMLVGAYLSGELASGAVRLAIGGASTKDGLADLRRRAVPLGLVGVACLGAVMVNPHGAAMYAYPFQTVGIEVLQQHIQEWQSPDFHMREMQPFLVLLMALLLVLASSGRTASPIELILVGGFGLLALLAARNVSLAALAMAPTLSRHAGGLLDRWPESWKSKPFSVGLVHRLNLLLAALLSVAALLRLVSSWPEAVSWNELERRFPVGAVSFIERERPPGPIFNSYNWGGFVVWSLYPEYQSFVDGRTDLFDDEILNAYLGLWTAAPGWEASLERWGLRAALIEPQAPLAEALQRAGWQERYRDEVAIVLVRAP